MSRAASCGVTKRSCLAGYRRLLMGQRISERAIRAVRVSTVRLMYTAVHSVLLIGHPRIWLCLIHGSRVHGVHGSPGSTGTPGSIGYAPVDPGTVLTGPVRPG